MSCLAMRHECRCPGPRHTVQGTQHTCNLPHSQVISTGTHNSKGRACSLQHTPAHTCHHVESKHQPHCEAQLSPEPLIGFLPLAAILPLDPSLRPLPRQAGLCAPRPHPPTHRRAAPPLPSQMNRHAHTAHDQMHAQPGPEHARPTQAPQARDGSPADAHTADHTSPNKGRPGCSRAAHACPHKHHSSQHNTGQCRSHPHDQGYATATPCTRLQHVSLHPRQRPAVARNGATALTPPPQLPHRHERTRLAHRC